MYIKYQYYFLYEWSHHYPGKSFICEIKSLGEIKITVKGTILVCQKSLHILLIMINQLINEHIRVQVHCVKSALDKGSRKKRSFLVARPPRGGGGGKGLATKKTKKTFF